MSSIEPGRAIEPTPTAEASAESGERKPRRGAIGAAPGTLHVDPSASVPVLSLTWIAEGDVIEERGVAIERVADRQMDSLTNFVEGKGDR